MPIIPLLLAPLLASASTTPNVGDEVIVVAEKQAELMDDGDVVATIPRGSRVDIQEISGDRYHVAWNDQQGWLHRSDALPLDAALDFFSAALSRRPNAQDYCIRATL